MLNKRNGLSKKEVLQILAVQVIICSAVAMAGVALLSSVQVMAL